MLLYQQFLQMYGVRKMDQIARPPLPRIGRFQLPKWSMVHYIGASIEDSGPRTDWVMFQRNDAPIKIKHVFELAKKEGNPRRTMQQSGELQRNFRSENPRFRNFSSAEDSMRMPMQVNVVNYAFIPRLYRYQRQRLTGWNKLYNLMYSVFAEIKEMEGQGFNQFLEIEVPKTLPKPSVLRNAEHFRTLEVYQTFSDPKLFMLLQIWKWLGPNRDTSMIHEIFPDGFKDLNIIIREADRFCVLPLSRLSEWRRATAKELRMNEDANRRGIAAEEAQLRFLRLFMAVANLRSEDLPENIYDDGSQDEGGVQIGPDGQPIAAGEFKDGTSTSTTAADYDEGSGGANGGPNGGGAAGNDKDEAYKEEIVSDIDVLEEFGADLDTLAVDTVTGLDIDGPDDAVDAEMVDGFAPLDQDALEAIQIEPVPAEPKEAYLRVCAELADQGDITAAEYRRAVEAAQAGKIAEVDGVPIDEFAEIPPEEIAVDPVQVMEDTDTVVDKSMLKTTLAEFDSKYVSEVMQKDIAGMVYALMGAGVQVTNYVAKEVSTINGDHVEYTVHVKPLVGKPSVLRFKIPKIDDEGTFTIGGVKYTSRKQRGALPIVKISPSRVVLTSYYGRIFVDRSEKRANNLEKWINTRIFNMGADDTNKIVVGMNAGRRFDSYAHRPRLYTILSRGFRDITVQLDEGKFFIEPFPVEGSPNALAEIKAKDIDGTYSLLGLDQETGAMLVINDRDEEFIVTMAESGDHYDVKPFSLLPALGLDAVKSPVEFAICNIAGADLPVGVVLGYYYGFNGLCSLLGVKPRRVAIGKRANLQDDEWAMQFEDQILVFSRKDKLATMILAGFRDHHRTLAEYPLAEFNHRDVYLMLLEEKKCGARHLREMMLLSRLFVDSITREILKDMKEPQVFRELLVRACELLLTDWHPHEQDARYMRVKGYERMAGILYGELVKAVRAQGSMPGKARYGIELHPYAVWNAIQQDSAKDQVSDINPIQNLKQQEAITYSGTGGRSSRTMVARTRVYHPSDMGLTSESTVDSSDVAVNAYMSANPKFKNLRGITEAFDFEKDGLPSLMSTSALVSPGSTRDD